MVRSKDTAKTSAKVSKPKSLALAKCGIRTGKDFSALMSALMTDLIEGSISPGVGNAACNAGGKLLKVVEMQMRYGRCATPDGEKVLVLAGDERPQLTN